MKFKRNFALFLSIFIALGLVLELNCFLLITAFLVLIFLGFGGTFFGIVGLSFLLFVPFFDLVDRGDLVEKFVICAFYSFCMMIVLQAMKFFKEIKRNP